MKKNKRIIYLRWGLLTLFTVLITLSAYLHQVLGGGKAPSIHALCPFGGLESLYTFFKAGTFIGKIFAGTMILFVITLVLAILFRRSFCGILCPFGAIQEFFAGIGRKIFRKHYVMPRILDRPLRYLKYVVLVITVFYAWRTAGLWMAPYDPWSAYAHLSEGLGLIWDEAPVGLILLFVTVAGSVLYDRFFCKYLCPMGAFYGIVGKISPFKVVRNEAKCIDCDICTKKCPANIDVARLDEVTTAECISCQTCVLNCPVAGALELQEGAKKVRPLTAIIMILALFFVPIFVAQSLGVYNLLPEKVAPGQVLKIEDVKGYMTIKEGAEATKMVLDEYYKKFRIPENVPDGTKMKEIRNIVPDYNFEKIKEDLRPKTAVPKEEAKSEKPDMEKQDKNAGAPPKKVDPQEARKINVRDIIGSMTISEAAASAGVENKEFYRLFKIPEDVSDATKMKDIKNLVPGYDFHKMKDALGE